MYSSEKVEKWNLIKTSESPIQNSVFKQTLPNIFCNPVLHLKNQFILLSLVKAVPEHALAPLIRNCPICFSPQNILSIILFCSPVDIFIYNTHIFLQLKQILFQPLSRNHVLDFPDDICDLLQFELVIFKH